MYNNGYGDDFSKVKIPREPKKMAEKTPRNSFRALLKKFASDTSFGGISKATLSDGILRRCLWAIISAVCYGFTIYMSYGLICTYLDKPVTTAVDISYEKNIQFPSVTICNLNKFRKSKLMKLEGIDALLNNFKNRRKNETSDFEKSFSRQIDSLKKTASQNSDISDTHNAVASDDVDEQSVIEQLVSIAASHNNEKDLMEVGHQYRDLVISCTWMGLNCKGGYFSEFWTPSWNWKFGNCFTFNPGANRSGDSLNILRTSMPGPNYGLSIDLNIQQMEYINELTDEAGLKIVIHTARQIPFPNDEGITIPPGFSSSVAIRKEIIQRVDPFKNGTCYPKKQLSEDNIYRQYNNGARVEYSVKACMKSCLALEQQKLCNCSDVQFSRLAGKVCETSDELTCMANVELKYTKNEIGCSSRCPQPCSQRGFRYSFMMSALSSNKKKNARKQIGENKTDDDVNNNLLRLRVFYEELNLQKIVQSTSYSLESLLGDVGGMLGLWIGISVISVAEFGDLLVSLLIVAVRKSGDRQKKTKISEIELK